MTWTAPKVREIACGMEINMYAPAEDDRYADERDERRARAKQP